MSDNLVPFRSGSVSTEPVSITAEVKAVNGETILLSSNVGVLTATPAVSCLVTPKSGDTVLACSTSSGCYVLAILERTDSEQIDLAFAADVCIRSKTGKVDIAAQTSTSLISGDETNLIGKAINLTGEQLSVQSHTLKNYAANIESHANSTKFVSNTIDVAANRVSQRFESLMRWVKSVETLNVGHLIQNVRKSKITKAEQVVLKATKDVAIDGERIHMG
jgi:hypothetical protein